MADRDRVGNFSERRLPDTRLIAIDWLDVGMRKHNVMGIVEIDVTLAREKLGEMGAEAPGFTAWVVKCIATAAGERPEVHGIKKGKKLIVFEDVDVTVLVEAEMKGKLVPRPSVIRKVNAKNIEEIDKRLSGHKKGTASGELVLGDRRSARLARFFLFMPGFLRRWGLRALAKRPFLAKKTMGTIVVTSLGMFGENVTGWALPISAHPLTFALGSITRKPGVVDDRIEIREYLQMTVVFDHDVVDGGPATRFTARLAELMASAHGLVPD